VVFDCDLSPSQQRNWEKLTKICVIDRQEVILDIFASRASTKEAVLQVELARLQYSLPRLTRAWTHLSRQRGGAKGTRGEGEQQIEVDRRLLQKRITQVKEELEQVKKHRLTQRRRRERGGISHAAIVGYTNAGKSSLLNALAESDVLVENKLFATLDPTTRKIELPGNMDMLLTDTVGFVRKLPHNLVEAFKSTLEEAVLADFLIIVLDISSPFLEEHWLTTLKVLEELGAESKEAVVVFNKVDLKDDPVLIARVKSLHNDYVFVSTRTGEGLDSLRRRLVSRISFGFTTVNLEIPASRHDIVSEAYARGKVLESVYRDDGTMEMKLKIADARKNKFKEFEKTN
jgi:GTP-binding protein HflX